MAESTPAVAADRVVPESFPDSGQPRPSTSASTAPDSSSRPASPPSVAAGGSARPEPTPDYGVWGWERGDRRFAMVVSVVALALMAVHWVRLTHWRPAAIKIERPATDDYRLVLDINRATWVEWMQLEGIGEVLGRRIVADREQRGPFADIDDLRRVPGIGPATLERIRPHLTAPSQVRIIEPEE